MLKRN